MSASPERIQSAPGSAVVGTPNAVARIHALTAPVCLVLVGLGALVASLCGVALNWDGAYYLFNLLESRQSFVANGRTTNIVLQAPTLLVQSLTGDLSILRLVFGLSYLAVPVVAVLASYLVVRRNERRLFAWAVIAITVAALPGQMNPSSEALQVGQLGWPILLGAIVGLRRDDPLGAVAALGSGLFVALGHPLGAVLLAGVAATAVLFRHRGVAIVGVALLVLSIVSGLHTANTYEANRLTMDTVVSSFRISLAGWVGVALGLSTAAAAMALIAERSRRAALIGGCALALELVAGFLFLRWAHNPIVWAGAIEFRTFAAVVGVPVALVAILDAARPSKRSAGAWRELLAMTCAAVFLGTMVIGGLTVRTIDQDLTRAMQNSSGACTAEETVPGANDTLIDSWATPSRSLLLDGRQPDHIVLPQAQCGSLAQGAVPVAPWDMRASNTSGWFVLRGLTR